MQQFVPNTISEAIELGNFTPLYDKIETLERN